MITRYGNRVSGNMPIDLAEQFSKLQSEISSGFERLEEILNKDKM